jgi:hypothetical protein
MNAASDSRYSYPLPRSKMAERLSAPRRGGQHASAKHPQNMSKRMEDILWRLQRAIVSEQHQREMFGTASLPATCAKFVSLYQAYEAAKRRRFAPQLLRDISDEIMLTALAMSPCTAIDDTIAEHSVSLALMHCVYG